MAEVYRAYRRESEEPRLGPYSVATKMPLAIKLLQKKWSLDPQLQAMFEAEAKLTTHLNHDNIVRVYETGNHEGVPFIAMEYVDGVTCAKLLRAVSDRDETFPEAVMLVIASELLKGLAYAHTAKDAAGAPLSIVHRDVSPGNILVSRTGRIKLTDFGIARSTQTEHTTDPGQVKGKFGYMSPEQVMGEDELDPRSDLYSLGVVMAEMLMGRRLFSGKGEYEMLTRMYESDTAILEEYAERSPVLVPLIQRALKRERTDRYDNALQFLQAVEDAAEDLGVPLDDSSLLPWLYERGVLPSRSGTYALHLEDSLSKTAVE